MSTRKERYDGERDWVDEILAEWGRERPDLDVSPVAIIGRLSRLSRVLEQDIETRYAAYGVQGGRFSVLAALRRSGPPYRMSPTDLYRSLLVSSGAMTNRLEHLESLGLIQRERDPRDRRFALVVLTKKGLALADRVFEAHLENERALLRALSRSRQAQLAELLRDLLVSLGDSPSTNAKSGSASGRRSAAASTASR